MLKINIDKLIYLGLKIEWYKIVHNYKNLISYLYSKNITMIENFFILINRNYQKMFILYIYM